MEAITDKKIKKTSLYIIKKKVLEKYNHVCQECGVKNFRKLSKDPGYINEWLDEKTFILEVHHIKPAHLGGSDEINNLIVLCVECHNKKHHKSK